MLEHMKHKLHNDQRGAVALITVIFVAILLTIVTTSFIRITVNEQRQATDDDLTKRAFFAAESGIEDGKIALDRYLNGEINIAELNGDTCDAPRDIDPEIEDLDGIEASYTCHLISLSSEVYESSISPWASRAIDLNAIDPAGAPANFSTMTLRWHDPVENGAYATRGDAQTELLPRTGWNSGGVAYPAMMRVQISSYPESGTFAASDAQTHVVFINPSTGGANPTANFIANDGSIISNGSCTPSLTSGYACEVTLDGFNDANRNYSVRVTSLYTATNMQLVLDGGSAEFDGALATIDVTGRAGDVYRRVQTRVSLASEDLLPDAAITSGQDVCKNFNITDVANDGPGGNEGFDDSNAGPDPYPNPAADNPNRLCQ